MNPIWITFIIVIVVFIVAFATMWIVESSKQKQTNINWTNLANKATTSPCQAGDITVTYPPNSNTHICIPAADQIHDSQVKCLIGNLDNTVQTMGSYQGKPNPVCLVGTSAPSADVAGHKCHTLMPGEKLYKYAKIASTPFSLCGDNL